jgi:hypothetical protein
MQLLNHHNQIAKNGIYSLITNNQIVDKIAFNYNTSESILGTLTTDEILDYINSNNIKNVNVITTENLNLKKIIKEQEIGKEYWKIAILLSLLFFALEILLLKMIKL